jgi:hypothetical protein
MAVTKGNGFPSRVQPAHLCFVSVARSVPLPVANPPPQSCPTESVCPRLSVLDRIEDVCLGATITFRTCGHFAAERTFSHGKSTSV